MPFEMSPPRPDLHDEPILVTGAAGFIGRAVADRLLTEGRRVIGVDSLEGAEPRLAEARLATLAARPSFSFERLDIADAEGTDALFRRVRPREVIHLAARAGVRASMETPHAFIRANIDGFLNVLEGCRHGEVAHLLYASSSSVYGAREETPFRESDAADRPTSLYAATKRADEHMAHAYAHLFRMPTTGLRFFTVYGPWGRPDMAVLSFARAIIAGRPIELFDGGALERDFTYVDDAAEAVLRLIERPPVPDMGGEDAGGAPARIVNIGNRRPVRVRELVAELESALGRKAVLRSAARPPADVPSTCAATDELRALTGFEPDTPLEEGIARFAAWFRDHEAAGAAAVAGRR